MLLYVFKAESSVDSKPDSPRGRPVTSTENGVSSGEETTKDRRVQQLLELEELHQQPFHVDTERNPHF